jgi:hypothetical protein
MVKLFDSDQYHQRNKVETVFSVVKRKFGESLKARKYRLQVKEIKIKEILYNLSRMMKSFSILIIVEEFYIAKNRIWRNGHESIQFISEP